MANRGYTNVRTFSGGIPAWKKAGFPLDTTAALPPVETPSIGLDEFRQVFHKVSVVDIRIPSLYQLGLYSKYMRAEIERTSMAHRKTYHHKIPLSRLPRDFGKINRDRRIFVVDHNGKQSKLASKFLISKGYRDVYYLEGGLMALAKQ